MTGGGSDTQMSSSMTSPATTETTDLPAQPLVVRSPSVWPSTPTKTTPTRQVIENVFF